MPFPTNNLFPETYPGGLLVSDPKTPHDKTGISTRVNLEISSVSRYNMKSRLGSFNPNSQPDSRLAR